MISMGPTGRVRRPSPSRAQPETQEQRDRRFERDKEWIEDELGAPSRAEWAARNPIDAMVRGADKGYQKLRTQHAGLRNKLLPGFLRKRGSSKVNQAGNVNF